MVSPEENSAFYASKEQRMILFALASNPLIKEAFFLTGGTALSVFYLYHRKSDDIDLFALPPVSLKGISLSIKRTWQKQAVILSESSDQLSCLIKDIRVDFVVDPLSSKGQRHYVLLKKGLKLRVDTIHNIIVNKFCSVVSRREPKDFIDIYFLFKRYNFFSLKDVYKMAGQREGLFDDPPTVAYQIEEGLSFIKDNPELLPKIIAEFDKNDFFNFFERCTEWIYNLIKLK